MMGEILPGKIRGSAASVATAFNWACTFVVTKTFADIIGESFKIFVDGRSFKNSFCLQPLSETMELSGSLDVFALSVFSL
jgi:hypothetical protein